MGSSTLSRDFASMKQISSWFKNAVTSFFDPEREFRIKNLVHAIHTGIQKQGPAFALEQAVSQIEHSDEDLREAKERVYRVALERGWSDGQLTTGEQKTAKWLAERLRLAPETSRNIDFEQARKCFGLALSHAMEDGVLEHEEEQRLAKIAAAVGCSLGEFMKTFFQNEGEAFLRSIFLACVSDNQLSQSDWNYLLHVTKQFGLQPDEMLQVVQPQARQFVEHVLADAKSDGRLSAHEKQALVWMVENLRLPADFRNYVRKEVQQLELLTEIDDGRLPSISMPTGMEHRSGEIVHWVGYVTWREHRARKDGMTAIDRDGVLAMTDNRLVFSSEMKSHTVSYRKIVSHQGTPSWLQLQVEGKPANVFLFRQPDLIPYAIFSAAVAMANQTKLAKADGGNTRHIPREVRQRVWQKYGGRCADCGAVDYLEFDHIIPVARGGSNMDANVQLLCRMCNSKKSDSI
jgi:tellurite resistance protein